MHPHTPPEILRSNLTGFILTLKSLGIVNILAFELLDVPSIEALQHGLESLYALGAIDEATQITPEGFDMAAFPVDPRVARMLLHSLVEGCSWEVLAVASALQVRDLWQGPPRSSRHQQRRIDYEAALSEIADASGDHVTYANLFAEDDDRGGLDADECRDRFLNHMALRRGLEVRQQLARFLRKYGRVQAFGLQAGGGGGAITTSTTDHEVHRSRAVRRCVTAGFFFNVAKLGNDGRYYTLRNQVLVTPAANSIFTTHATISSEYIIFGETADGARGGLELRSVSAIEAQWLRELAPHYWE
jgi:HrpA-like RNA helicase